MSNCYEGYDTGTPSCYYTDKHVRESGECEECGIQLCGDPDCELETHPHSETGYCAQHSLEDCEKHLARELHSEHPDAEFISDITAEIARWKAELA